jgi:hypothetical protein
MVAIGALFSEETPKEKWSKMKPASQPNRAKPFLPDDDGKRYRSPKASRLAHNNNTNNL